MVSRQREPAVLAPLVAISLLTLSPQPALATDFTVSLNAGASTGPANVSRTDTSPVSMTYGDTITMGSLSDAGAGNRGTAFIRVNTALALDSSEGCERLGIQHLAHQVGIELTLSPPPPVRRSGVCLSRRATKGSYLRARGQYGKKEQNMDSHKNYKILKLI